MRKAEILRSFQKRIFEVKRKICQKSSKMSSSKRKRLKQSTPEQRHEIQGYLTHLSHVFYITGRNKVFFLKIQEQNVVVPISLKQFHFLQTENDLPIGEKLRITGLIRLEQPVAFQATSKSRIEVIAEDVEETVGDQDLRLDLLQGVVTDDSDAQSGIYVLNKRLTLVTTSLCHITNIRYENQPRNYELSD